MNRNLLVGAGVGALLALAFRGKRRRGGKLSSLVRGAVLGAVGAGAATAFGVRVPLLTGGRAA